MALQIKTYKRDHMNYIDLIDSERPDDVPFTLMTLDLSNEDIRQSKLIGNYSSQAVFDFFKNLNEKLNSKNNNESTKPSVIEQAIADAIRNNGLNIGGNKS